MLKLLTGWVLSPSVPGVGPGLVVQVYQCLRPLGDPPHLHMWEAWRCSPMHGCFAFAKEVLARGVSLRCP